MQSTLQTIQPSYRIEVYRSSEQIHSTVLVPGPLLPSLFDQVEVRNVEVHDDGRHEQPHPDEENRQEERVHGARNPVEMIGSRPTAARRNAMPMTPRPAFAYLECVPTFAIRSAISALLGWAWFSGIGSDRSLSSLS